MLLGKQSSWMTTVYMLFIIMFACKTKMVRWMITKPLWVFSATLTCWGGRTPVYYVHTSTLYWTSSGRFVSPFIENISPSSHHHSSNNNNDTGQNEEDRDDKGELSCWGTSSTWGKQQTNDIWDIFKVTLTSDFPYLIQTSKQDCPGDQNNTWHFLEKKTYRRETETIIVELIWYSQDTWNPPMFPLYRNSTLSLPGSGLAPLLVGISRVWLFPRYLGQQ